MNIADIIVVMNGGRIEDIGRAERVYLRPRTRFVARFLGSSNLIDARVRRQVGNEIEVDTGMGRLVVDGRAEIGQQVLLSIRPEQIGLGEAGDNAVVIGRATVRERTFQGAHVRVRATLDANEPIDLEINLPPSAEISVGDTVPLATRKQDIVLIRA